MFMTKKQKFWIAFGAVATSVLVPLISFGCVFALVSMVYNPSLSSRIVNVCSNDDNYYSYTAIFKEFTYKDTGYFAITAIQPEEKWFKRERPDQFGNFKVRLFSSNLNETFDRFSPSEGLSFDFVAIGIALGSGSFIAVVQLSVEDKNVLSFEDGKAALIEWAKKVH